MYCMQGMQQVFNKNVSLSRREISRLKCMSELMTTKLSYLLRHNNFAEQPFILHISISKQSYLFLNVRVQARYSY